MKIDKEWLDKIFKENTEDISRAVDSFDCSDTDKEQLKASLDDIQEESVKFIEKELVILELKAREAARANGPKETWLSTNIRPLSLAWGLISITILAFLDGGVTAFALKDSYISLFETILTAMFVAYFGSRGWEKTTQYMNTRDTQIDELDR